MLYNADHVPMFAVVFGGAQLAGANYQISELYQYDPCRHVWLHRSTTYRDTSAHQARRFNTWSDRRRGQQQAKGFDSTAIVCKKQTSASELVA